jgi:hypothetical protein
MAQVRLFNLELARGSIVNPVYCWSISAAIPTMKHLPHHATDEELITFAVRWAELMESEEYAAAFAFTWHTPEMNWTPERIREVVKAYADADPAQKVTLNGTPTDISQRKHVARWPRNAHGAVGEIWYDLNIDGLVSDLTATFVILDDSDGLLIALNDIHVM